VFCRNYLASKDFQRNADADQRGDDDDDGARPASSTAASGGAPQDKTAGQKSADAVKEGVSQGINKLRGLFGGK
jgi:hypothetical protein